MTRTLSASTPRNVSFDDLAIFAAVARTGSFRAIAQARRLSPSAVSKAVRRLEAQLGLTLLERTTRSVFPTRDGARLLERLAPALLEVEAAVAWVVLPPAAGIRDAGAVERTMPELDRRTWP